MSGCGSLAPHAEHSLSSRQHFEEPKPGGKFLALPQPAATLLGSGWLPGTDTARPTPCTLPVLVEASPKPAFLETLCVGMAFNARWRTSALTAFFICFLHDSSSK